MLEINEVVNKPTEEDVRQIFTNVFGQAKVLQTMLKETFDDYIFRHGITCEKVDMTISPTVITVRMGDFLLFHEIREWVTDMSTLSLEGSNGKEANV